LGTFKAKVGKERKKNSPTWDGRPSDISEPVHSAVEEDTRKDLGIKSRGSLPGKGYPWGG